MEENKKQKIGLMGGTFNPIHYGHLLIAENAYEQFQLDMVIFIPTGNSPHKDTEHILGARERSEMIQLAIADNPHFIYSDYEITKTDVSYTHVTLQFFHDRFPDSDLYFIMGADSLAYFESWNHPEIISRLSTILAAVRGRLNAEELHPVQEQLRQKFGTKIGLINTPNFSVSSRMIRQRITEHRSVRYLVPDSVEQYLRQHNIYI